MKGFNRILRISLYMLGIFLTFASCAKEQTYGGNDEPDSPTSNGKADICRIGNDVIRLSVLTDSYGEGCLFLSTTPEFSSTPFEKVKSQDSWSPNSNGQQHMYPFYITGIEKNQKYYYSVTNYDDNLASGSFVMKDISDILTVKKMTPLKNGLELTLSAPVWFINTIFSTSIIIGSYVENNGGSINIVTHEITYKVSGSAVEANSEYEYKLSFLTKDGGDFYTTIGTGLFTTTTK